LKDSTSNLHSDANVYVSFVPPGCAAHSSWHNSLLGLIDALTARLLPCYALMMISMSFWHVGRKACHDFVPLTYG